MVYTKTLTNTYTFGTTTFYFADNLDVSTQINSLVPNGYKLLEWSVQGTNCVNDGAFISDANKKANTSASINIRCMQRADAAYIIKILAIKDI